MAGARNVDLVLERTRFGGFTGDKAMYDVSALPYTYAGDHPDGLVGAIQVDAGLGGERPRVRVRAVQRVDVVGQAARSRTSRNSLDDIPVPSTVPSSCSA